MEETKAIYDIAIYAAYFLVGLAAIATIVFAVRQIVTNFDNLKIPILGAVVLLVVLLIAYALSSGTTIDPTVGETTTKLVGGGLLATFILIGIAIVAAIFSEVSSYFK
jgi:hypothetical protein